jgi:hypothetical protein
MQPLPGIAGGAGAATGCIRMAVGAIASGPVAGLYDGYSALSMTALMAIPKTEIARRLIRAASGYLKRCRMARPMSGR